MLKDQVIAQLNMLVESMKDPDFDTSDLEVDGIEVETPDFVLKVIVDRGMCEDCNDNAPIEGESICLECNYDRLDRQRMQDWYGE